MEMSQQNNYSENTTQDHDPFSGSITWKWRAYRGLGLGAEPIVMRSGEKYFYGRTLSDASMLYFADVFYILFMAALVGQTAERIFTKLSHMVDIRCYLRTY